MNTGKYKLPYQSTEMVFIKSVLLYFDNLF